METLKTGINTSIDFEINLKQMVAKRAQSLLWGNGYELVEENEVIQEVLDDQNFISLMSDVERNLSMNGESIVIIDFDGNNDMRFTLSDNFTVQTLTNGKIIWARTIRKVSYGPYLYQITEIWSLQQGRSVIISEINELAKDVTLLDYNSMVTPELQIDENYTFNEIPIVLFQNLNSVGNKSEPDGQNASGLQELIDKTLKQYYLETDINRTRWLIDKGNEKLIKEIQNKGIAGFVDNDVLFKTDNNASEERTKNPAFSFERGNPNFTTYQDSINYLVETYFDVAGYSYRKDSEAMSNSVVGTLFTNKKDLETTRNKKKIREEQCNYFLHLIAKLLDQDDVTMKIKANIMYEEQTKINFLTAAKNLGVLTDKVAIKVLFNYTDEEAEDYLKEVEDEQKHNQLQLGETNSSQEDVTGVQPEQEDSDDSLRSV